MAAYGSSTSAHWYTTLPIAWREVVRQSGFPTIITRPTGRETGTEAADIPLLDEMKSSRLAPHDPVPRIIHRVGCEAIRIEKRENIGRCWLSVGGLGGGDKAFFFHHDAKALQFLVCFM